MTVQFICPHCGARSIVRDELVGHSGRCFTCGKPIEVAGQMAPEVTDRNHASVKAAASSRHSISPAIVVLLAIVGLLGLGGIVGLFVYLMAPIVMQAQQASHRKECGENLRRIAIAMQRYHDANGHFPPAYVADAQGKPMHSWRVLLLPYLGEQALFQQYDMSEPWDSWKNKLVTKKIPAVYHCPSDPSARSFDETSYVVLVGSRTMFPDARTTSRADLTDGPSRTLMVVEVQASGILWTEPKDLAAKSLVFSINVPANKEIGSQHPQGAHALTADGNVLFLSDVTPPDVLESMTTIKGGEPIPAYVFKRDGER